MASISIIVPIFNVERYLSACLDSLRAQTLRDIEVICIDDGSCDRSLLIARKHAKVDSRITVLHQENAGVSAARNEAMKHASGEYLLFIDADDYIDKHTCEMLLSKFKETDADVITFGSKFVPESAANDYLRTTLSPRDIEYNCFSSDILFKEASMPYACRTAVRRSFLVENHIEFAEGVALGEDVLFYFEIYPLAKKTVFMSNRFYAYRLTRKDSAVNSSIANPDQTIESHIELIGKVLDVWTSRQLMGLCPLELLKWAIEFVMWDILDKDAERREKLFVRFGNVLKSRFPDALTIARHEGGFLLNLVDRLFSASESGSAKGVSDSYARQYLKYLWGSKVYYRRKLMAPLVRLKSFLKRFLPLPADSQRRYLYETADDIVYRVAEQEALTTSLILLSAEEKECGKIA